MASRATFCFGAGAVCVGGNMAGTQIVLRRITPIDPRAFTATRTVTDPRIARAMLVTHVDSFIDTREKIRYVRPGAITPRDCNPGSLFEGRSPMFCVGPTAPPGTSTEIFWVPAGYPAGSGFWNADSSSSYGNWSGYSQTGIYTYGLPKALPTQPQCRGYIEKVATAAVGIWGYIRSNSARYSAQVVKAAGQAAAGILDAIEFLGVLIATLAPGEFLFLLATVGLAMYVLLSAIFYCYMS